MPRFTSSFSNCLFVTSVLPHEEAQTPAQPCVPVHGHSLVTHQPPPAAPGPPRGQTPVSPQHGRASNVLLGDNWNHQAYKFSSVAWPYPQCSPEVPLVKGSHVADEWSWCVTQLQKLIYDIVGLVSCRSLSVPSGSEHPEGLMIHRQYRLYLENSSRFSNNNDLGETSHKHVCSHYILQVASKEALKKLSH